MLKQSKLLRTGALVLTMILLFGAYGCSKDNPTAPQEDPDPNSDRIESTKSQTFDIAEVHRAERVVLPAAPTDLRAEVVPHPAAIAKCMCVLNWRDNSDDEFCFIVERKVGDMGEWIPIVELEAGCVTYQDCHLRNRCMVYYRVQNRGPNGLSSFSNEVSVLNDRSSCIVRNVK